MRQPQYSMKSQAAIEDERLYALLALADALRVGRAREKNLAIKEMKSRIC